MKYCLLSLYTESQGETIKCDDIVEIVSQSMPYPAETINNQSLIIHVKNIFKTVKYDKDLKVFENLKRKPPPEDINTLVASVKKLSDSVVSTI